MRLLSAFFLALIMAAVAGTTRADKLDPNEKDWSYRPFVPTSVLPEQEPNGVCPGQAMACGDEIQPAALDPAGDLDWFSFYVDETFRCVTIGTDSYQGSSTDTYLELYDACDGSILAYDDDGGPGLFSLISQFIAPHPGTYYVKVRGYSQTTVGAYTLFLWCTDLPLPPPNDRCEGAYPIERCTAGTLDGTLSNYTNDYDPWGGPQPSCTGWTARGRDATYQLDLQMADICHFVYTQYVDDASFYIVTDCDNVNQSCVIGADATVSQARPHPADRGDQSGNGGGSPEHVGCCLLRQQPGHATTDQADAHHAEQGQPRVQALSHILMVTRKLRARQSPMTPPPGA